MLNRRILRLKAMQALYALEQAQRSNYQLGLEYIHNQFEPDLNAMNIPSAQEVAEKRQTGKTLFEENYQNESLSSTSQDEEIDRVVSGAMRFYNTQIEKERKIRLNEMLEQTEAIREDYLKLVQLLIQLAERSAEDFHERKNRKYAKEIVYETELNFSKNTVIQHLKEHQELTELLKGVSWQTENVKSWFKILHKEEFYQNYMTLQEPSFLQDKEFVVTLARDFIFQNETLDSFFEENDILWAENRSVLRNMLLKTVKNIEEDTDQVELYLLSRNWDDDRAFFRELYQHTVQGSESNEQLISERLKNWNISRVAIMDVIILKMALSEMMHFPSIPVKVTINEYVELAKNYSTPKSKEFVNGILDTISEQLLNEGKIKKSGRGLLDNQ